MITVSSIIPYLNHELQSKLLRVAVVRDHGSGEQGEEQRLRILEFLIKQGADVNYKDGLPLLEAARRGRFSAVLLLIAAGAWRNASEVAVPAAAEEGYKDIVEILFNMGANIALGSNQALRSSAARGHTDDVVQFIITRGMIIDDTISAALILAVRSGHEHTVNVLIEAGAEIGAFNDQALHLAMKYEYAGIV